MTLTKKLLLTLALMGATTAPSFANEEFSAPPSDSSYSEDATADRWDRRDRRDRWRRQHTCFARNAARRTFVGRDWNIRRAQREALRSCQGRSFGPLRWSCRLVGCR